MANKDAGPWNVITFATTAERLAYAVSGAEIGRTIGLDNETATHFLAKATGAGAGSWAAFDSTDLLPLAGGTMTGDIAMARGVITWAPTNADGDANKVHISMQPAADGASTTAPFQFLHLRALFTATYDHSYKLGVNVDRAAAAQGAQAILWEHNFDHDGAGHIWDEMHNSMWAPAGNEVRVWTAVMEWATGLAFGAHFVDKFNIYRPSDSKTRMQMQDTAVIGHEIMDYFQDTLRFYDVADNHVIMQFNGSAIDGAGSYDGYISTTNFYFYDASNANKEQLTIWGKDSGAARVMLARTTAPPAGGLTDLGLRMGNGSQFGVFFGSGAPTLSANLGALYLRSTTGGVPQYNVDASTGWAMLASTYTVGSITASTTQTQVGGTALTGWINEVTVCANTNDTVTLPAIAGVKRCVVMNNGAQTLKVYPASGEDLGAGVDASTTIVAAACKMFTAYNTTKWRGTAL